MVRRFSNTPPAQNEWHVYTTLGGVLREAGVDLPHLYASTTEAGRYWLLIEDIAAPLPRDRWLADPQVTAMLARLHAIPPQHLELHRDRYMPDWSPGLDASALGLFGPDTEGQLSELLASIRTGSSHLFEPACLISADPNPANWGVRHDGSPVLFDWERCTLATPAIDLAISVPGLGDRSDYEKVAAYYPSRYEGLVDDIARAKVWVVIEFLAGYAAGTTNPTFDIAPLISAFPEWVKSLDLP